MTNYINEEHTSMTKEQTMNVVKLMNELDYDVEYGQQVAWEFEDDHQRLEFETDLGECIEIASMRENPFIQTKAEYDAEKSQSEGIKIFTIDEINEYIQQQKREEVMCDCGCWEYKTQVMTTSTGTSCIDCYDIMSR